MAIFIREKLLKFTLQYNKLVNKHACSKSNYSTVAEAVFKLPPYKLHLLEKGPPSEIAVTRDCAFNMYRDMVLIRRMEAHAGNMYRSKIIRGFLHLYSGEEAVAVGIKALLKPLDKVITSYRCHGWAYLHSRSEDGILAELAGKVTGLSRGKGGSMHLFANKFYGGNGIVGAQVSIGTGIALAEKIRNRNNVCVTIYGDGAANQGQVFESYNIASLFKLPCVYLCENNGYGMGTSDKRSSANPLYYKRCEYIPGIQVDGMDVVTMREVTKFALEHCAQGKGPIIIEAITYRYMGHSMSDPGTSYRSREEVAQIREQKDPIRTFKNKILAKKLLTREEVAKVDRDIKEQLDKAAKAALAAKVPPLEELATDIYALPLTPTCRNVDIWNPLTIKATGIQINV